MKRLCVLLICAAMLLGVTHPAIAADRWNRVITDHFETVGNSSDSDVRRIAQGDAGVPEVQLHTRHTG